MADDKSIGLAGFLFPGTRGNIQRSMDKKRTIINLTKFRLALRFSWAKALHSLTPSELIKLGLRDPAMAFIKGEGHPPRKVQTCTWRLIWVVSELDRLLDGPNPPPFQPSHPNFPTFTGFRCWFFFGISELLGGSSQDL